MRILCLFGLHTWKRITRVSVIGTYYVECQHCAKIRGKMT